MAERFFATLEGELLARQTFGPHIVARTSWPARRSSSTSQ